MSEYLCDRFGRNLTKYDIQNLKKKIRDVLGKKVKIPRSKKEVLKLSYTIDSIKTLEYLTKKSDIDLRESLERYRNMIFETGMNTQDPKQAKEMLEKFEKTEKRYQSILKEEDYHDVLPFPPKAIEQLRERVKIFSSKEPSSHPTLEN